MSDDDKALVERLRVLHAEFEGQGGKHYSAALFGECADRIEALSAANERLREALDSVVDDLAEGILIAEDDGASEDWLTAAKARLQNARAALGEQQ